MPAERGPRFRLGDEIAERYVVEKLLGKGGMGEVYEARDKKLRRRVAIKILVGAESESEVARERLRREAAAVAQLGHPGIVAVYDVIDEADGVLVIMELVEGRSLRARMDAKSIAPDTAAEIVAAIASALAAAHEQGLVHRDVKPENVILRSDGRIALLDFGIAKQLGQFDDASGAAATLTDPGVMVGTPLYLAPEQARGAAVTPAADQFSLAVVAYEMLAGAPPWPLDNIPRIIAAILVEKPAPIAASSGLDPEVDAVLARALAKKADDRYPSITEFASALEAALPAAPRIGSSSSARRASPELGATVAAPVQPSPILTPAPSPSPAATPSRTVSYLPFAVGLVVLIVAFVAGVTKLSPAAPQPNASASTSASTSNTATGFRFTELAPSRTAVPAAAAAYRRAMQELGRGDVAAEIHQLDAALAADPDLATAHLQRLVYETYRCPTVLDVARPHFLAAKREEAALDDRDRDLLEALAPAVSDPPDLAEVAVRMRALAKKRPTDAQIFDVLGIAENKLFHFRESAEAHERAAALDPAESMPGAIALAQDFREPERSKIIDACLSHAESAINCRYERILGEHLSGACKAAEDDARAMTVLHPDASGGPAMLARSLAGEDASVEALGRALADRRARLDPSRRETEAARDGASLAAWTGDFAGALDLVAKVKNDPAWSSEMRVRLLTEVGDAKGAGEAAVAYVKESAALPRFERPESDPMPFMLAKARAGGATTDAAYAAARDAWIASWKKRLDAEAWTSAGPIVWALAFSSPANAAEARSALDHLPSFGPLPPMRDRQFWTHDGPTGDLLRLAGRLDDAIPRLRSESQRCSYEMIRVDALLGLGLALEANGDKAEACASYRAVLDRWGAAKPRSVSAEQARAHAKTLACGPS